MAKKDAFQRRIDELEQKIFAPDKPKREEGYRCTQCGEWLGTGGRCANRC